MSISTIPFLFAGQCGFLVYAARAASKRVQGGSTAVISAVVICTGLLAWGATSTWLGLTGVYDDTAFLNLLPGLWLPLVPIIITSLLILVLPLVRTGIHDIAVHTPAHWLVGIHALRIAALGTLLLATRDKFPLHVELAIGLTDLVFGISAVFIYKRVRDGRFSSDALMVWHAAGFLLIVVPGEIAIQTGLPGQMQVFSSGPTSELMLDLPMVLAPSLVVPIFLLFNLLGIYAAAVAPTAAPSR